MTPTPQKPRRVFRITLISFATLFGLFILFLFTPAILGIFIHDEPLQDDSDLRPVSAETSGKKSAVEELKALELACASLEGVTDFSAEFPDVRSLYDEFSLNTDNWEAVRPRAEKHAALIQRFLSHNKTCLTALTPLSTTPNLQWPWNRGALVPNEWDGRGKSEIWEIPVVALGASRLTTLAIMDLARNGDWAQAVEKTKELIRIGTWMAESSEAGLLVKMVGLAIYDDGIRSLRLLASHPHADPNEVCQSADGLGTSTQFKINALIGGVKDEYNQFRQSWKIIGDSFISGISSPEKLFKSIQPDIRRRDKRVPLFMNHWDQPNENEWVAFFLRQIPKSAWHYWFMPNTTLNQAATRFRAVLQTIKTPSRCVALDSLINKDIASRRSRLPLPLIAPILYVSPNAFHEFIGVVTGMSLLRHLKESLCEPSPTDASLSQAAMAIFAYQHRTGKWPATLDEATQGCLTAPLAPTLAGNTVGYSPIDNPKEVVIYEQNAAGERVVGSDGHEVGLTLTAPVAPETKPPSEEAKQENPPTPTQKPSCVDGKGVDLKQGLFGLIDLAKNRKGTLKILRDCKPILIQVN